MEELSKHGAVGLAAIKAGMDRKTARKYIAAATLPSQMRAPRDWRTREDPFAEHREEIEALLRDTPALEAKTVFELLTVKHPDRFAPGQLRTLQRMIRAWRAAQGADKEVVLAQRHRPGEAAQTDFTSTGELAVTIAGEAFVHLLCVVVLPFSNWLWATVCLSESIAAIRKGLQRALFQLGRVPQFHQTDHSTAATHRPSVSAPDPEGRQRPFNEEYLAIMRHFSLTPRTTEVGAKEQNGDVEAANGALKRRLEQALLVRGSRDFESVEAWQAFVDEVVRKANTGRGPRVAEEIAAMRVLDVGKLQEFREEVAQVSEWSTIRVKGCSYSVPSRLIGEALQVRLYEDRLEAFYRGKLELSCERLRGRRQHRIDYRHVIWSLVCKPGGFARYVYRDEMFPSLVFRRAYDALQTPDRGVAGDVEYLRILHLAASTMESDVTAALTLLLAEGGALTSERVKALVLGERRPTVPEMPALTVDLRDYDALLGEVGT
ncbi:MAG: transposase family protein [Deltaproteobacteria bacterium]|nr:transposase family protein [Deltaproteobacteria bacterium]MBP6835411.1 transposase family protein [Deltaproteobacteria bacterium]